MRERLNVPLVKCIINGWVVIPVENDIDVLVLRDHSHDCLDLLRRSYRFPTFDHVHLEVHHGLHVCLNGQSQLIRQFSILLGFFQILKHAFLDVINWFIEIQLIEKDADHDSYLSREVVFKFILHFPF